ncbi:MAG: hypothetical protein ACYTHM_04055 [Planctomycetota bacterium]|jgi:hypothetical protein
MKVFLLCLLPAIALLSCGRELPEKPGRCPRCGGIVADKSIDYQGVIQGIWRNEKGFVCEFKNDGTYICTMQDKEIDDKGKYYLHNFRLILDGERCGIYTYHLISYKDGILMLSLFGERELTWIKLGE